MDEGAVRQPLSNVMRMTVQELHKYADAMSSASSSKQQPRVVSDTIDVSNEQQIEPNAVMWKEKGNESFRKQAYQRAVDCYSRSIDCPADCETRISALANRSMSYLKLERYQECIDDCTKVLERDPDHVKSYVRRGAAKQQLGHVVGAIEDFEECIRRETHNVDAIKGRQESIALYLSRGMGLHTFPEHEILVTVDGVSEQEHSVRDGGSRERHIRNIDKSMQRDSSAGEPHQRPMGAQQSRQSTDGGRNDQGKDVEVTTGIRHISIKTEYKTGIEFEKAWRGCRGDSECQATILITVFPDILPKLLKQCLNPKLLYQITSVTLSHIMPRDPKHGVALLLSLSKTDRFLMNCMSLSKSQRADLATLWHAQTLVLDGPTRDMGSSEKDAFHTLRETYRIAPRT